MTLSELERQHLLETLVRYQWNKTAAAKHLGVATKTIYNLIEYYDLKAIDLYPELNKELEFKNV